MRFNARDALGAIASVGAGQLQGRLAAQQAIQDAAVKAQAAQLQRDEFSQKQGEFTRQRAYDYAHSLQGLMTPENMKYLQDNGLLEPLGREINAANQVAAGAVPHTSWSPQNPFTDIVPPSPGTQALVNAGNMAAYGSYPGSPVIGPSASAQGPFTQLRQHPLLGAPQTGSPGALGVPPVNAPASPHLLSVGLPKAPEATLPPLSAYPAPPEVVQPERRPLGYTLGQSLDVNKDTRAAEQQNFDIDKAKREFNRQISQGDWDNALKSAEFLSKLGIDTQANFRDTFKMIADAAGKYHKAGGDPAAFMKPFLMNHLGPGFETMNPVAVRNYLKSNGVADSMIDQVMGGGVSGVVPNPAEGPGAGGANPAGQPQAPAQMSMMGVGGTPYAEGGTPPPLPPVAPGGNPLAAVTLQPGSEPVRSSANRIPGAEKLAGMPTEVESAARQALQAAVQAGIGVRVNSGVRSREKQAGLYADYKAGKSKYPAAPPGRSLHEQGLAMDLSATTGTQEDLARALEPYGWKWAGAKDKVHFTFVGNPGTSAVAGSRQELQNAPTGAPGGQQTAPAPEPAPGAALGQVGLKTPATASGVSNPYDAAKDTFRSQIWNLYTGIGGAKAGIPANYLLDQFKDKPGLQRMTGEVIRTANAQQNSSQYPGIPVPDFYGAQSPEPTDFRNTLGYKEVGIPEVQTTPLVPNAGFSRVAGAQQTTGGGGNPEVATTAGPGAPAPAPGRTAPPPPAAPAKPNKAPARNMPASSLPLPGAGPSVFGMPAGPGGPSVFGRAPAPNEPSLLGMAPAPNEQFALVPPPGMHERVVAPPVGPLPSGPGSLAHVSAPGMVGRVVAPNTPFAALPPTAKRSVVSEIGAWQKKPFSPIIQKWMKDYHIADPVDQQQLYANIYGNLIPRLVAANMGDAAIKRTLYKTLATTYRVARG